MKVLCAEDDLYTREALKTIFEEEGWQVRAYADGKNALLAFAADTFDLVCLDVMMPGLSGYDVCKEIRKKDSSIPVLFISAKSEEIDKVLGLELGADDFIVKPFGVRELSARVRAIMRRQNRFGSHDKPIPIEATAQDFAFGPWTISPASLRANWDSLRVDLVPRELLMLQVLAENEGKVVSRAQFFRRCWDLEQAPLSRTLDQHIAQLRKKLEKNPKNVQFIHTVQGLGYRFENSADT